MISLYKSLRSYILLSIQERNKSIIYETSLLLLLYFGIPKFFKYIISMMGFFSFSIGSIFFLRGSWEYGIVGSRHIPETEDYIVTSGIYEYVRHPIYGGIILQVVGLALISGSIDKTVAAIMFSVLLVIC
jgi:protein-S-isoprenylcysteine O-methyltransferase Ste14